MNIAEVETKIRAAVAEAKAEGWRIRAGMYYFVPLDKSYRQCCPLFACVRNDDALSDCDIRYRSADFLGVSPGDALSIVYGFDGAGASSYSARTNEFIALGDRLRDLVDQ